MEHLKTFKSYGYVDTVSFAHDLAKDIKAGTVICLRGDLGAGKTAFVQGFARGLGIEEYITSPTFTIVNVYESGRLPLYHFDVYRISNSDEMYEIGYEEYVYGDGISIIEWPQLIEDILPDTRYEINILKNMDIDENYREIEIYKV